MNPIAAQLNQTIKAGAPHVYDMLSDVGKKLFFPKGILSQSAEAKQKAHAINATIGIAKEGGRTMRFDSVVAAINAIPPSQSLTYAPSFGIPALRKQWQVDMVEKNPSLAGKTVSLPVVTCGITHGISTFADMYCPAIAIAVNETSMPPESRTINTPIASIPIPALLFRRSKIFSSVRNCGLIAVITMENATSTKNR